MVQELRNVVRGAWGPDSWHGYMRGSSVTSVPASYRGNPRLQKCVSVLFPFYNDYELALLPSGSGSPALHRA